MAKSSSVKITKRVIDQIDTSRGRHYVWDSEIKGFGVQVEKTGTITYIVRYRPKGHGRDGKKRFLKIGRHGDVTAEQAREQAKGIVGAVAMNRDPVSEQAEERKAETVKRQRLTVSEVAEIFLTEHVDAKRKPMTASQYRSLATLHIMPVIGRLPAADVTRADIAKLHLNKMETRHTANRMVAFLSSMYSFAAKHLLVPEGCNPAKGIERYREQSRERFLTSEELLRLSDALAEAETVGVPWQLRPGTAISKHTPKIQIVVFDRHAIAAIRLLLFTGARLQEILTLRWQNVDLERGVLFLPDSKTGKKTIILSAAAHAIIQALRVARQETNGTVEGATFVIRGLENDRPRSDLKKPWAAVRRRAKLDGVRLHDLRHTFASVGAGASLGLPVVGKLLGHTQAQTTARYAHLDTDPLRRAANIIGNQLSAAMAGSASGRAEQFPSAPARHLPASRLEHGDFEP